MEQNPRGPWDGREPSGGVDADRLRSPETWRRSRSDRVLAGVCGGIGRSLNIDPVLVRVMMAVLVFVGGVGIPLYAAGWLLMPEEGAQTSPAQSLFGNRARPDHPWLWPIVVGVAIFCAIGLASSVNMSPFSFPGPLIGLFLLWFFVFRKKNGDRRPTDHPQWHGHWQPPTPPTTPASGPASSAYPASSTSSATPAAAPGTAPVDQTTGAATPGAGTVQPVWTEDDPLGLYVDEPPASTLTTQPERHPARRGVKPVVLLVTAVAMLIAWAAGSTPPAIAAIGLSVLGAGMLIGGFLGRTRGLVPVGILLAVALAATSVFDTVPKVSDASYTVRETDPKISATNATYRMDAGSMQIDLSRAHFGPDAVVSAHGRFGEIKLVLPPNVDITGTAASDFGEVRTPGQKRGGHDVVLPLDDLGADRKAGPESVKLDLQLEFGSIVVERR
jgi:phage shock protein PspC (stress-responsive transcriptional regulator)